MAPRHCYSDEIHDEYYMNTMLNQTSMGLISRNQTSIPKNEIIKERNEIYSDGCYILVGREIFGV